MKKNLIINGSPRKNGATAKIIKYISSRLDGNIHIVDTYIVNVAACTDCRYCWEHSKCAINDEMQSIYTQIDQADNIIIASPIYFAELTGKLLSWASRLQYLYVANRFKCESVLSKKLRKGAIILVDGGDGYSDTAFAMGRRLIRTMGADELKEFRVYYSGTDKQGMDNPIEDINTRISIDKLAEKLNN